MGCVGCTGAPLLLEASCVALCAFYGVSLLCPRVSYLMVMILSRVEHASILFLLQRVSPIVHLGGGSTCHSAWSHFQRFLRASTLAAEALSSDGEGDR